MRPLCFCPSVAHFLLKQSVLNSHLSYTATNFWSPGWLLKTDSTVRPKKKNCVIRVTGWPYFILPTLQHFFFIYLKKKKQKKNPVGQNGDFRRYVAGLRPRSRQHQASCHIYGRIFAPWCLSWDTQTCLPGPIANIDFSSPVGDLRNALGVRTSHYIFPNNWGGTTYLPFFCAAVSP
jgi:hypothetical protein